MTTPLLQYAARFDGGGEIVGFGGGVTRRVGHGAPCSRILVSICCAK